MISHLTKPRQFKSIAVWICVLMPISGTAYGQITQIIDQSGNWEGNTLVYPLGIAADVSGNVFVAGYSPTIGHRRQIGPV